MFKEFGDFLTNNRNVGEEIKVSVRLPEGVTVDNITVEGATLVKTEDTSKPNEKNITYSLTAQTVKILGDLTTLIAIITASPR